MLLAYKCEDCGKIQNHFHEDSTCVQCGSKSLTYKEGLVLDCDQCGKDFLATNEQAECGLAFCPTCEPHVPILMPGESID